jgi:glycerophosphoryl diester phosphodiesterase
MGKPAGRSGTPASPQELQASWVILQVELVNRELVEEIHSAEKKIMAWTINRPADMRRLAELGVDAIVSDETELLIESVGKR